MHHAYNSTNSGDLAMYKMALSIFMVYQFAVSFGVNKQQFLIE